MEDYLREIEVYADQLKAIASPLSDEDLVAYALMGLPQESEAFITSMTHGHDTITFEELVVSHTLVLIKATLNSKHHTTVLVVVAVVRMAELLHPKLLIR